MAEPNRADPNVLEPDLAAGDPSPRQRKPRQRKRGQPVRHRDQARPTTYQNLIHPDKEQRDAPNREYSNRERPTASPIIPSRVMTDGTETFFFSR